MKQLTNLKHIYFIYNGTKNMMNLTKYVQNPYNENNTNTDQEN